MIPSGRGLAGKRILIVEDDWFIADALRRLLVAMAVDVVGPLRTVDAALDLVAAEPLDAALVDINLDGAMSHPVADALQARNVPFALTTGYADWMIPARFVAAPRLAKPADGPSVAALLGRLAA